MKALSDVDFRLTMRQIALEAACSHTAIYRYFASKEILLFELSAPHLEKLRRALEKVRDRGDIDHQERLSQVGLQFVKFGLRHRTLMRVLVQVEASRMVLADALSLAADDERLLAFSRIFFYLLEGIVMTYELSKESSEELLRRLRPTLISGFKACLSGFRAEIG